MIKAFRARVLHYYVAREYLKNLALALVAVTIFYTALLLILKATEVEDFGISVGDLILLTPFMMPWVMTGAFPLACMMAAITVFGRMASDNEIQAAHAGGASVGLLAMPVLFLAFVISSVSLWCSDQGMDWGFSKIRNHFLTLENEDLLEKLEKPGSTFPLQMDGGRVAVISMLPRMPEREGSQRILRPIHIAFFDGVQLVDSLYAREHEYSAPSVDEKGSLSMGITLQGAQTLSENPMFFEQLELTLPLPKLEEQINLFSGSGSEPLLINWREARELRASIPLRQDFILDRAAELVAQAAAGSPADPSMPLLAGKQWMEVRTAAAQVDGARSKAQKKLAEFHRKLALAFLPLSLVILGIGLGLLVRKGNRAVGFVLGLLAYLLTFYPPMVISKEFANAGAAPPWVLWAPNVLILVLGIALWWSHNRGYLDASLPQWMRLGWLVPSRKVLYGAFYNAIWQRLTRLEWWRALPFRRKAERHVAASFLAPLLLIALAVAMLFVLLDLVEHGGEVIKGVSLRLEPLGNMEPRSLPRALSDVGVYYAIRGLSMLFDLMPVVILIAGVLAVTIMVRNNEHLIFKSVGAPLQRVFRPILLTAALLALGITLVRETVLPSLIMERDRLKPLVYHRTPKSKSMAGQSEDAQGRPIIYEIERFSRNLHRCEGLRIYMPQESVDGRIPRLVADRADWDHEYQCWNLKSRKPHAPANSEDDEHFADGGRLIKPIPTPPEQRSQRGSFFMHTEEKHTFDGVLSPAFLESEKLGTKVMRLGELWTLRSRPAFGAELWRRACEWLTGLLLLMVCIPLLVRNEVRNPLIGIAVCMAYGAVYLGLTLGVTEAASRAMLGSTAFVALPHLVFLAMAMVSYRYRMET